MKCHQVLTGACNPGDKTFAVGSVEGMLNSHLGTTRVYLLNDL
jgi:hypothetical protein